jgi:hypothetical protein
VEEISFTTAREYVVQHHYAHSYPADSRRFGLFLDDPEEGIALVGVAVFGIPAQPKVLLSAFPGLIAVEQSLELSRFVLEGAPRPAGLDAAAGVARGAGVGVVDRAPANSETWFLARAMSSLAATGVRGVISFADPVPRRVNGELVFGGHCGTIYAAHNAVFAGRSTTRTLTILPDGSSLNARSAQKVRSQEQGHDHVERRLMSFGARCPRAGENPRSWLAQALVDVGATRLRHRGCYRFLWTLGGPRQRARTQLGFQAQKPYPKSPDEEAV